MNDDLTNYLDQLDAVSRQILQRYPDLGRGPAGAQNLCRMSVGYLEHVQREKIIHLLETPIGYDVNGNAFQVSVEDN